MWIDKLDNMHVILTAEEGMSTITIFIHTFIDAQMLDEFERDFEELRKEMRDLKDSLKERSEMLEQFNQSTPE